MSGISLSPRLGRSNLHPSGRLGRSAISLPSGFDPRSLGNLAAWYDARYPAGIGGSIPSDGTALSQWNDLSGNGRHATQGTGANQPLWHASGVAFDGTNSTLAWAGVPPPGPFTVYVVTTAVTPVVVTGYLLSIGNVNGYGMAVSGSGRLELYRGVTTYTDGAVSATPEVRSAAWPTAATSVPDERVNGVSVSLSGAPSTPSPPSGGFALGAGDLGAISKYKGTIAAVLVYSAAHTTTQRQAVERWLGRTFGVSVA